MSQKVVAYNGGTAAANELYTAVQSAWVSVPSLSANPIYIQAGVTSVYSTDVLFQNTASAIWGIHTADHFVVGT